jgi:hypothetical protein
MLRFLQGERQCHGSIRAAGLWGTLTAARAILEFVRGRIA